MKLDENSFNLKEEAEIKGGGLPKGAREVGIKETSSVIAKINTATVSELNGDNIGSLIEISTKSTWGRPLIGKELFTKINELFGKEKTGKSLHFLKASFFKTDENTIYTYSEHRTPMELVEDFSEYYTIEFNNRGNTDLKDFNDDMKATNNLMKLINILFVFCKNTGDKFSITAIAYSKIIHKCIIDKHLEVNDKLNQEDKNKKKLLLLNDGLNPLDNIEALKSYDISTILLDNNKINPYEIFKSIKEIDKLLYAIIEKIFTGFDASDNDVTNNIKSKLENAINACFSDIDDLKEDISFINMKGNDYIKLYKNISEKFKASLDTLELDKKISAEKAILELLITKIDKLKDNINQLNKNITSDHESTTINAVIEAADKVIDANAKEAQMKQQQQQQKEQEWKAQDFKAMWQQSGGLGTGSTRASGGGNNTKELRKKLNTMSIKQLKILSDKNHIKYGNKNTIKSLINNYMKHI